MLVPLRDEHLLHREVRLIARDAAQPLQEVAADLHCDGATLLVVEDPTEPSLRGSCPAPLLEADDGTDLTLGWLRLDAPELSAYANRAVALLRRPADTPLPIALLGPREQRYVELLEQLARAAESAPALAPFRWNAERLARHRLADALRQGAAAAIFTGHGNARGWFAYGGMGVEALTDGRSPTADDSIGVLFSLSCRTGQPAETNEQGEVCQARSLADAVVGRGIAGAVLAPVDDPLHENNRVLAAALIRAAARGQRSCADIVRAARDDGACVDGYVIVGDPATPVAAAPDALERCKAVFAPAPGAILSRS